MNERGRAARLDKLPNDAQGILRLPQWINRRY